MDRTDWLKEMRREAELRYDTLWAPQYSEKWGTYDNASHQKFLQKFLSHISPPATILDAACGAGRYMPMLLEKGHTVLGIDQSQGMLASARARYPTVQLEKIGLQELAFEEIFDGAICMDAMEHVFPEDWVPVLANLHRALRPHGYLYFTVELDTSERVEEAFTRGRLLGLPVVRGEWVDGEVYHYYPPMEQVREWIRQVGFEPVEEGQGDDYHHFIVRRR
jgi:SAM-dependent methyltransferase